MKYISLYRRYYCTYNESHDSLVSAIKYLQESEDEGEIMPIAVIHKNKMVWYKEFLGKEVCNNLVKEFIKSNETQI